MSHDDKDDENDLLSLQTVLMETEETKTGEEVGSEYEYSVDKYLLDRELERMEWDRLQEDLFPFGPGQGNQTEGDDG